VNVFFSVDEGRGQSDQLDRINQIEGGVNQKSGNISIRCTFTQNQSIDTKVGNTGKQAFKKQETQRIDTKVGNTGKQAFNNLKK
jgi:hypothetical protein